MLYKGIVMQIDELTKFTMLFDAYGKLLSDKQHSVMDKFLNLDISESEMAELENSSRQSIHDAVTKAKKQLLEFENKCGFVEQKTMLLSCLKELCESTSDEKTREELEKIITKF
jgi:predicted DNA-binding protein YlxM (UPF0122 family)